MVIEILGEKESLAYKVAQEVVSRRGHTQDDGKYFVTDLAIAPLLLTKVSPEELRRPRNGTLIFHPSPLPYGRGASSIKWAYRREEPITAATWFWADNGLDTGDVCEQEIIKIDYALRPREFYEQHLIPALARTLERCLIGVETGIKRRVPQVSEYSSFDARL